MVENEHKFISTSVVKFFSPVIEVEGEMENINASKGDNSIFSKSEETLACEELLELVTSFPNPKVNLEK